MLVYTKNSLLVYFSFYQICDVCMQPNDKMLVNFFLYTNGTIDDGVNCTITF